MDKKEPRWLRIARKEIGVSEIPGKESNERILEYFMECSWKAKDDRVSWCSAFVTWCLEMAGVPSTRSAAAISYLDWSVPIGRPIIGCVVILSRKDPSNPNAAHVGFCVGETDKTVLLLGGNQGDKVCIQAYDKSKVLGYRMPEPDIMIDLDRSN